MIDYDISVQSIGNACILKPPLSADMNASLPLVIFYMNLMKVDAAGIVDKHNHCVGFVTCDDVIDHVCDEKQAESDLCVSDVMRPPNMSVYLDDPIEQALIMMKLHKIDWLPVIDFDTQEFSGLVCREDLENLPSHIIPFLKRKFPYEGAA